MASCDCEKNRIESKDEIVREDKSHRIKQVNHVFLATILISIAGQSVNGWLYRRTGNLLLILLSSQIMIILPAAVYLITQKINIKEAIRFKGIRLSNVMLLILFSYLISPLMGLINGLSMLYVENDTAGMIAGITQNNSFLISLFMIAMVPGILEEAVYRGVIYNQYKKVSVLGGILLSGFLFGIMHQNINQFSYAFVMGIIFAFLVEATDSILSTIIVHFIINGTSVVMLYILPMFFKLMEGVYGPELFNAEQLIQSLGSTGDGLTAEIVLTTYGIPAVLCSILAFMVYKAMAKNANRWEYIKGIFRRKEEDREEERESKKSLFSISLILAIAICVGLMVYTELLSKAEIERSMDTTLTILRQLR